MPDALDIAGVRVTNVTSVAFEATVTPAGLVRAYSLSFRGEVDGRLVTVRERVTYSALGATAVEPPAWTDRVHRTGPDCSRATEGRTAVGSDGRMGAG